MSKVLVSVRLTEFLCEAYRRGMIPADIRPSPVDATSKRIRIEFSDPVYPHHCVYVYCYDDGTLSAESDNAEFLKQHSCFAHQIPELCQSIEEFMESDSPQKSRLVDDFADAELSVVYSTDNNSFGKMLPAEYFAGSDLCASKAEAVPIWARLGCEEDDDYPFVPPGESRRDDVPYWAQVWHKVQKTSSVYVTDSAGTFKLCFAVPTQASKAYLWTRDRITRSRIPDWEASRYYYLPVDSEYMHEMNLDMILSVDNTPLGEANA